ncbi:VP3 [Gokushovirus WZ-2015a]|nr:VP3 [Gokushovirus WZ-2015a]
MAVFRTWTEAKEVHLRVSSNLGSRVKTVYSPVFDETGHMELREAGKEDLYAYIQSHKESCDIHVILERFAKGDVTALQRRQAMFADFTEFPKTYAEMLNSIQTAENYFNSLPVDIRANFNHDFHQFLASMDKSDFLDRMGLEPKIPLNNQEPASTPAQVPPVVSAPSAPGSEVE